MDRLTAESGVFSPSISRCACRVSEVRRGAKGEREREKSSHMISEARRRQPTREERLRSKMTGCKYRRHLLMPLPTERIVAIMLSHTFHVFIGHFGRRNCGKMNFFLLTSFGFLTTASRRVGSVLSLVLSLSFVCEYPFSTMAMVYAAGLPAWHHARYRAQAHATPGVTF